jgi:hypothetical protein
VILIHVTMLNENAWSWVVIEVVDVERNASQHSAVSLWQQNG